MKKYIILWALVSTVLLSQQTKEKQKDTLEVKLNQITITATRYPEKIMEIPYAVSILPLEQLKLKRGYGLDEAISSIPGVLAQSRSGNQDIRLVIRGFGARGAGDRSNYGTSRGIRVMVDGIPETEPDGRTSFDLIDIASADHIEVIRSNASATWGNAAGGVVNISTIPSSNSSFVNLKGFAGSFGFNQVQLQAMQKLSVGKLFASVTNTNYDGWRTHSNSTRALANVGLSSMLGPKTEVGVFILAASNVFHVPGPLTQKQFDSDRTIANATYLKNDERRHNRLGRIGVTLDHQLDESNSISGMTFVSPKYLQRSERGTFRDFTRYHFGGNLIYKNKINLSDEISNQLVAGFDEAYQDGAILFYSLSVSPLPPNQRGDILKDNKREGTNTFGAFLQNELMIDEKLSIIFGGRFDKITYYSESYINPKYGLQEKFFDKFTPKAGLTYRLNSTLSLYANIGGGVEVPAGNETDPSGAYGQDLVYLINPLLDPIESSTIEIGIKNLLYFSKDKLIQYINYDLALYDINVKNDIIPYRGGRFYFTAGKTNRKGAELGLELQSNIGINLRASFTFSQNEYDDYLVDSVHYGRAGKFADYSGKKVAGIPPLFYNFTLSYQPEFIKGVFASFGMQSVSSYFVDDANLIQVPSFGIFNASFGINDGIKLFSNISVSGFMTINNIFDLKYASSAFINPDIVSGEAYFLRAWLTPKYGFFFTD